MKQKNLVLLIFIALFTSYAAVLADLSINELRYVQRIAPTGDNPAEQFIGYDANNNAIVRAYLNSESNSEQIRIENLRNLASALFDSAEKCIWIRTLINAFDEYATPEDLSNNSAKVKIVRKNLEIYNRPFPGESESICSIQDGFEFRHYSWRELREMARRSRR